MPVDKLEDIAEDVVAHIAKDSKEQAKQFLHSPKDLIKTVKSDLSRPDFFQKIAHKIADHLKVEESRIVKQKKKVINFICSSRNFLSNLHEELREQADLD